MNMRFEDTIVAPATIPGTGAISIIRVSGPDALALSDKVVHLRNGSIASSKGYTIHYGDVTLEDGSRLDDVLVSVFRNPHSYTGEDSVEISCHASRYIVEQLLSLLCRAGARMAGPGEFTQRAFVNGKMDLAQAEAVADVIAAQSAAAHKVAYSQMRGHFSKELEQMSDELVDMASLLELELDFSEEEVEFADRSKLNSLLEGLLAHVSRLIDSFRLGNAIKNGVPVAIVGAANSGKSTLLNALLGEDRAIVSDIAGTTRDSIEETLNIDGILFRFIDTAGIRETGETIEKIGIDRAFKKLSEADIVLAVVDGSADAVEIKANLKEILGRIDFASQTLIILVNKADKAENIVFNKNVTVINNLVSSVDRQVDTLQIAAKSGEGLDSLRKMLADKKKSQIESADSTLITNVRHLEALREARTSLLRVRDSLEAGIPSDLVAQDLREAIATLNSILGRHIDSTTILNHIFKNHCIGK
ncbi:MAG: tRNA uridine-5-carboxymethylaminomethyl(34) synthesis GTPase MnmE [Candidatus Cryptobacteroides sp.]|nr:tRNA uridine-5-carboxymethylaminomethyl(34) synthesis GTPase MnmE [Candidatus Cryptobacteroides sp.]